MVMIRDTSVKRLVFSEFWEVLGPFQTGTREATWGADPLERLGGFRSIDYDPLATFPSSLAPNGLVSWSRHSIEDCCETGSLSSSLSQPGSAVTKLVVEFPGIDWQSLQAIYGWAALQWQAWARGIICVAETSTVLLYTDNMLEFWVDDQHYFGGDMYGYRRAPLVLHLKPGRHTLNVRLVRDVRLLGGLNQPNVSIEFKAEVSTCGLAILHDSLILPETVNGMPASHYGSVNLLNTSSDWICIHNVEWDNTRRGVNSITGQLALEMHQKAPLQFAPGQSRPFLFRLIFSGFKLVRFCLSIGYSSRTSPDKIMRKVVVCSLTEKELHDPHKMTFLHPSGIVSYAILRPPSSKACAAGKTSMPILLNLHGAGLDADSCQVRRMLEPVPDLPAWVLFPTGVTPWSGDDWHVWGFADAEAAINAVPSWIESTAWSGPSADIDSWLVCGHSNGGQGTWYTLTHRPDNIIGAAPVSSYTSIQGYVPYLFWKEADPKATSIVQDALRSYRHELLVSNFSGIPVLQQHGSADKNVPVFHSRRLNQLISEVNKPHSNLYYEIQGQGHWYDGVMTTEPLRAFYERILRNPRSPALPFKFSIVVSNPADMGPRGGLLIEQLRAPDQLGGIDVIRDRCSDTWSLRTSNISQLSFTPGPYFQEMPHEVVIDGQRMGSMSKKWLLSICFARASDGSWNSLENRGGQYGKRPRSQMGPLESILRSTGRFAIQAMSPECETTTLQVARNLFQYFAADTEIIGREDLPHGSFGLICIGKGTDVGWINQGKHAIKAMETRKITLDMHDGTQKSFGFEEGIGVIFLAPCSNGGLELIIWGLDNCGLRQAARLLPMLTGVGQPEFIIVRKRCAWDGAAGVLAMGSFDKFWKVSEFSFIT